MCVSYFVGCKYVALALQCCRFIPQVKDLHVHFISHDGTKNTVTHQVKGYQVSRWLKYEVHFVQIISKSLQLWVAVIPNTPWRRAQTRHCTGSPRRTYQSTVSGPCGSRPNCRDRINVCLHLVRSDSHLELLNQCAWLASCQWTNIQVDALSLSRPCLPRACSVPYEDWMKKPCV